MTFVNVEDSEPTSPFVCAREKKQFHRESNPISQGSNRSLSFALALVGPGQRTGEEGRQAYSHIRTLGTLVCHRLIALSEAFGAVPTFLYFFD